MDTKIGSMMLFPLDILISKFNFKEIEDESNGSAHSLRPLFDQLILKTSPDKLIDLQNADEMVVGSIKETSSDSESDTKFIIKFNITDKTYQLEGNDDASESDSSKEEELKKESFTPTGDSSTKSLKDQEAHVVKE